MIDLSYFLDSGVFHFNHRVDKKESEFLLRKVFGSRVFGPNIFVDEASFKLNPMFKGVNPKPGRNLAEEFESYTKYIDQDDNIIEGLEAILGSGYEVMDKKFVCGVPISWIPDWVQALIDDTGVKNLGPYIKPEYRDITYFCGIDFHQDIIDWPEMGPEFITLYVYLDDVGVNDAPLHVLPRTHVFGATSFPHNLERLDDDIWKYESLNGTSENFKCKLLTGECGSVSLWHPFILHGTQPDSNTKPRVSLRYLIKAGKRGSEERSALSVLNKSIKGPMALSSTRCDLNREGEAIVKGNHVNKIKYS